VAEDALDDLKTLALLNQFGGVGVAQMMQGV